MNGVALIGCGAWGINLARNFHTLGGLRVICDKEPERLEKVKERFAQVQLSTEFETILAREDIRAVAIATPSVTHAEMALKALEAGKDVLVEKPMALSVMQGEQLVEAARRHSCVLMVGHVMEYHPAVLKLRELLSHGELGKVYYIYSNRLNLGHIRTEENSLWSFAPHDVAIIQRLVTEMPQTVSCQGGAYLSHRVADATLTHLTFPSGIRAHIFVSWLHPFKEHKLVVVGHRQMAVFNDVLPWEEKLVLYPHKVDWVEGRIPVACQSEAISVELDRIEPLMAECKHFLHCIKTREKPLTDGESGLEVLRVLETAQKSLEQDGQLVTLDPHLEERFYFAHPTATIDPGGEIGEDTHIWHYSHVMPQVKIGKNCVLGQNVFVGRNAMIGNGVKIQNNVSVYEGVVLEDHVFCGPSVVFTNVLNPRSQVERKSEFRRTLVREGATLGANCTIICGVTIGRYAFVGAGAVATKDVPDYALVIDVPARITGWVCRCANELHFESGEARCQACGERYRKVSPKKVEHVQSSTTIRIETGESHEQSPD